jgi:hypothetical protein
LRLLCPVGAALGILAVPCAAIANAAATSPTGPCLDTLARTIAAIGAPQAGEVASLLAEVSRGYRDLKEQGDKSDEELAAFEPKEWKLKFDDKELRQKCTEFNAAQKALNVEVADYARRLRVHAADKNQHDIAAAAPNLNSAQRASLDGWAERGNARRDILNHEYEQLVARQAALDARRKSLAPLLEDLSARRSALERKRRHLDEDASSIVAQCSALLAHADALRQIRDAPARQVAGAGYRAPDDLAEDTVSELEKGVAKEIALKALESKAGRDAFKRAFRAATGKAAGKTGDAVLEAAGGYVIPIADVLVDVDTVGVEARTVEVERNLLLIGDYGAAMKQLVDAKKADAKNDPAYWEMRMELHRLAAGMPGSSPEVALDGLVTSAAVSRAFLEVGKHYVGKAAGKFVGKGWNHLDNAERSALGPGGVMATRMLGTAAATTAAETELQERGRKIISGGGGFEPLEPAAAPDFDATRIGGAP